MNIFIPTPLRPYTDGKDAVQVHAATLSEALDELTRTYPDLRKHLFTGEGKLRAFVNLYLNDEDVRYLPNKEQTAVSASDTLSIIPSIAGGIGSKPPFAHRSRAASFAGASLCRQAPGKCVRILV
jgi:adenylyltransferase/sulfurtransferase